MTSKKSQDNQVFLGVLATLSKFSDFADLPFRFTPKSRHLNSVMECPLCAKSGHSANIKSLHWRRP
jgi:hypothetical protein